MKASWVINIHNQCQKAGTAFFFKQWVELTRKKQGVSLRDGLGMECL
ncbi:MAG TPA: DUF5131 family protein [Burkholderiales bacterium]|nr:DUF5131 family protein [Burkholderiales bacterium]